MWKLALGFAVFAGLALFILMKSGGDIDMSGESHSVGSHAPAADHAPSGAAAAGAAAPASAASN